jgi:hypothetical protein
MYSRRSGCHVSTVSQRRARAARFFWAVLASATAASVAGNVTNAVAHGGEHAAVAAVASVVPPVVLLAATHGLSLMVRTNIAGRLYRAALVLTAALGACAFVLSFHSLYRVAVELAGIPSAIAWLWPLAVDLSVAQSTLALLAITTGPRARREALEAERPPVTAASPRKRAPRPRPVRVVPEAA